MMVDSEGTLTPFRWRFREVDIRAGADVSLPLMSVSLYKGVVPRADLMDSEGRADDLSNYKVCEPGDIVLNRMSAYQGALGLSREKGLVSPDYAVLRPNADWDGRYLVYLMKSQWFLGQIVMRLKGIGSIEQANVRTPRINIEDLGGILAPAPPIEEQRRIADFLDDQVGRIDQAIEDRNTQSKLLEESFDARLESEISGRYPWRRLRTVLALLRDGTHNPPERVSAGVPLLTAKNLRGHRLAFNDKDTHVSATDADVLDRSLELRAHDLLMSIKGTVGNVGLIPENCPRFQIERNISVLRPQAETLTSSWLYWAMRARQTQEAISLAMGFSAQPGIYLGAIGDLRIPVPSVAVQIKKSTELDIRATEVGLQSQMLNSSKLLLEHRKRSLITAAVTGQLDVTSARPLTSPWASNGFSASVESPGYTAGLVL